MSWLRQGRISVPAAACHTTVRCSLDLLRPDLPSHRSLPARKHPFHGNHGLGFKLLLASGYTFIFLGRLPAFGGQPIDSKHLDVCLMLCSLVGSRSRDLLKAAQGSSYCRLTHRPVFGDIYAQCKTGTIVRVPCFPEGRNCRNEGAEDCRQLLKSLRQPWQELSNLCSSHGSINSVQKPQSSIDVELRNMVCFRLCCCLWLGRHNGVESFCGTILPRRLRALDLVNAARRSSACCRWQGLDWALHIWSLAVAADSGQAGAKA